ncbi:MAG TPA: heparan-alpha-glucosaminide N-acetyltransferase domain-containing protein [Polyangiaceae bacterium]|nr:heparan-alpha-glucosaminide N-acetyltransferase domain-containing protein [Polyangiaceae bacterium]
MTTLGWQRWAAPAALATTVIASRQRAAYVDVFRGLLIVHMALDHASLMFNAGRPAEEVAAVRPELPSDVFQFLTRFTGVSVAPGFCFMAGFMVALTSTAREQRGVPAHEVTRRLVKRGLVLVAVDALILGLPRAANGFYSFAVLSCIGVSLILLAWLRQASSRHLLPLALGILLLHPLLDVSALPVPLQAVLHEPVRSGTFRSLYPLIPWSAIVVLGFVVGRDALTRERPERFWLLLSGASLLTFLAVRFGGGYGNAFTHGGVTNLDFWLFAKYPPDLAFLSWSFTLNFAGLALLRAVTRADIPTVLRPFAIFGKVPFFFYVIHFYVLGIAAALLRTKFLLPGTYFVWACLLLVMAWPCVWYARKKAERPNLVTRYF